MPAFEIGTCTQTATKVDGARAPQRFLVDPEEIQRILENLVVLVDPFGEALGVEKAFLRSGDDVQDVGLLVPPHPPRAENVPLLRRVPELKSLGEAGQRRGLSQVPEGKAVKGRDRQV